MNPNLDPSQLGLRDIHLPGEIAWWPLAFGWWLLATAIVGVGLVLLVRYVRLRWHRAAYRSLYRTIKAIEAGAEPSACAMEASTTLRRFAMTMAQDAAEVAGLVGDRWLAYLDSRWGRSEFNNGRGQLLVSSPYRTSASPAVEESLELCQLCVAWIRAQPTRR